LNVSSIGGAVHRLYERTAAKTESVIQALERRYTPLGRFTPVPFGGWQFLWQPALLGLLALTSILVGASFSNSPFKVDTAHTWFFGVQTQDGTPFLPANETTLMFSIVLVFGGMLLLLRVWLRLAEIVKHHSGAPVRTLWKILGIWSIPMMVAPPLFSRDVFSYAAQGEMVSHHLSPYVLGPFSLGSGPWVTAVDVRWGNTPAPYGPLFLFFDGSITKIANHDWIATVVGLRLLECAAVALLAAALPWLATAVGRDPGEALVLGALNPLVLLTLIGGAHNDALMAALLVTGIGFAVRKKPVWGIFLCACATAVKAPAALGIVYIAWTWLGPKVNWRQKLKPAAIAAAVTGATLVAFSLLAGFGFGWVRNLLTPGQVRSWPAPATGIGLGLSRLAHVLGLSSVTDNGTITVTRVVGLVAAAALMVWLFMRSERHGWIRALGVSLIAFVLLSPVVQPWYLVWGIVLLAVSYKGREHFWMLLLTIIGPFLGVPGGRTLIDGVLRANVLGVIASLVFLGAMLVVPLGAWTQWSWPVLKRPDIPVSA
jgi:energy-converting hydrogenase Eha subunit B